VIGKPGTSKSYAVDRLDDVKLKLDEDVRLTVKRYMSSKSASPDGIRSQFLDAAFQVMMNGNFRVTHGCGEIVSSGNNEVIPLVFLDEMGLGHVNPKKPMKCLHSILDLGIDVNDSGFRLKIPTIGVSNYVMDYANMNRVIFVCTELPETTEIQNVFLVALIDSLRANSARPCLSSKEFSEFPQCKILCGRNLSEKDLCKIIESEREKIGKVLNAVLGGVQFTLSLRSVFSAYDLIQQALNLSVEKKNKNELIWLARKLALEL
jgi:hypothetical protein